MKDKAGIRNLLQLVLPHQGFDVLPALGGEEAVELCRQHHGEVDLVLLDVRCRGGRPRHADCSIPVVVQDEDAAAARWAGVQDAG